MNIFRRAVMLRSVKRSGRPSHSADMRIEIGDTTASLVYGENAGFVLNLNLMHVGTFLTRACVHIRDGHTWLSPDESTKHPWSCLYE